MQHTDVDASALEQRLVRALRTAYIQGDPPDDAVRDFLANHPRPRDVGVPYLLRGFALNVHWPNNEPAESASVMPDPRTVEKFGRSVT